MGEPALKLESESRFAAYLRAERETGIKHEYRSGKIIAMAGGTPRHSAIGATVIGELHQQLQGKPCEPHGSDLRLRVNENTFYPDAQVVCPPPVLDNELPNTVLNPRVIVEVLSPSTETTDRGFKWFHYQQIAELADYVLIAVKQHIVEHYSRQGDGSWRYQKLGDGDVLRLPSIECEIQVDAIYAREAMWPVDGE
jgi:Uma2 family endonuclease